MLGIGVRIGIRLLTDSYSERISNRGAIMSRKEAYQVTVSGCTVTPSTNM
jgi:hypothetical protein